MSIVPSIAFAADYSSAENVAEGMLLDPANHLGIASADVSIGTQRVTIDCITNFSDPETSLEQFGMFLGGVLGVYISMINAVPEAGDLLIVMKNRNQPTVATLSCPKSWVANMDFTNEDAAGELMTKVFLTMKKA